MLYRFAADGLVLFHLSFIVFVMVGGLLLLRWPRLCWLHLPAVAWGIMVELLHLPCPLTEWENRLRAAAGDIGYPDSFVEHYLIPVIYPAKLTPGIQLWLGALVIAVNALVYLWLWRSRRRSAVH
ncbi:DUF2784 domain-containing protein [Pseudomonas aegrilactucae]|uniref:DUF2784 domain-containing protein n=1 Tax=Pseudomonas aegrilactucae TaxID=2854028 RepID=A0A9Q2XQN4_9PSED|nr:DUF2784 domain-containing protein [Pseudomonas aegrilactucae]MBV6290365.1 DUF2784 domain-containing protein [Pseudomonas aegrilactucae]